MISRPRRNYYSLVFSVIGALPFFCAVLLNSGKDLWWDELRSLTECSLAGFAATVTKYSDTNNHVFFNIIIGFLSKALGISTLSDAMDKVIVLRLVQAFFGILTLLYVYHFARRFIGRPKAPVAIVLLSTTIPFLNFATQLRGYCLSTFLVSALVFHAWSCAAKPSRSQGVLIAVLTCLLFYTIPSNAYFIASLFAVLAADFLPVPRKKPSGPAGFSGKGALFVLLCIGIGAVLAVLAYLPLLSQIFDCFYVNQRAPSRFFVPFDLFPKVSAMLLSSRFFLPVLCAAGIARAAAQRLKGRPLPADSLVFVRLLALYILPFVICFADNSCPLDRSFVLLSPIFALLLTSGLSLFSSFFPKKPEILTAAVSLYCLITCGWATHSIQRQLDNDIVAGTRHQDLLRNDYLSCRWHPGEDFRAFALEYRKNPAPVIVMDDVDRVAAYAYLNKISGFDYYGIMVLKDTSGKSEYEELRPAFDEMRSCNILEKMYTKPPPDDAQGLFIRQLVALLAGKKIAPQGSCYIITACPRKVAITLHKLSPKFDPVQLNSALSFTNVLRITIPEQLFLP